LPSANYHSRSDPDGIHAITLVGAAVMMHADREILICRGIARTSVYALLTASDNLSVPAFPARPVAIVPGDFQMMDVRQRRSSPREF